MFNHLIPSPVLLGLAQAAAAAPSSGVWARSPSADFSMRQSSAARQFSAVWC
ncbi:MAG TPA: hypothetical protein VGA58_03445 [bacterium]